jgi:hypothetical protein
MKEQIEKLVAEELERAMAKYGRFASKHESFGIMWEEYQEALEEWEFVSSRAEALGRLLQEKERRNFEGYLKGLRQAALACAAELIQVAAMCDKYGMGCGKDDKNATGEHALGA